MEYVTYDRGDRISLRKKRAEYLLKRNFMDITWFRPTCWSETETDGYGSLQGVYEASSPLTLLNLGSISNRNFIEELLPESKKHLIDPDEQYSRHERNYELHKYLMDNPNFMCFDGTIITENLCDDENLEGAEEVVLFRRAYDKIELI